jgi:hypothetical protein
MSSPPNDIRYGFMADRAKRDQIAHVFVSQPLIGHMVYFKLELLAAACAAFVFIVFEPRQSLDSPFNRS